MIFNIKNFGKISDASINLNGITVICGDNDTGKSTVGKALLAFGNTFNNYKNKILTEKTNIFTKFADSLSESSKLCASLHPIVVQDIIKNFIQYHDGKYTINELQDFLQINYLSNKVKEKLSRLIEYLNVSDISIINEYALRNFNDVMNNQIKNVFVAHDDKCVISAELNKNNTKVTIDNRSCVCDINNAIYFNAYYINNPSIIDLLNQENMSLQEISVFERTGLIDNIIKTQAAIDHDAMTNIIDIVNNKKNIQVIKNVMKQAYKGDTIRSDGKYYYCENGINFDFRNISAGLKSFAIIERLLETGILKCKDVLIIDTPEIYLNSKWQIIYTEMLVMLQKIFDLKILLITHSFQFLESLEFFMNKYEISDKVNYYIPEKTAKSFSMKLCENDITSLKQNLAKKL